MLQTITNNNITYESFSKYASVVLIKGKINLDSEINFPDNIRAVVFDHDSYLGSRGVQTMIDIVNSNPDIKFFINTSNAHPNAFPNHVVRHCRKIIETDDELIERLCGYILRSNK